MCQRNLVAPAATLNMPEATVQETMLGEPSNLSFAARRSTSRRTYEG
jgi:hypothetical protein